MNDTPTRVVGFPRVVPQPPFVDTSAGMSKRLSGRQLASDWDAFSANYHAESVTPFAKGMRFRLRTDLRRLLADWAQARRRRRRIFCDFGCGPGDALELVAGKAAFAIGIDFAPRMLQLAAQRLRQRGVASETTTARSAWRRVQSYAEVADTNDAAPTTLLVEADLRKLSALRGRVDAATSINSICAANRRDAERVFHEMARSLRAGGRLYTVWPTLESLEYLFDLQRAAGDPPETHGESLNGDGVHVDASGYTLKLFRADEIEALCNAAGLRLRVIEKIRYPWSYMQSLGWGDFSRRPCLWDWYTIAEAE